VGAGTETARALVSEAIRSKRSRTVRRWFSRMVDLKRMPGPSDAKILRAESQFGVRVWLVSTFTAILRGG